MAIEIKVPTLGESVTEATVGQWFKNEGDAVTRDEPLVELETDKVTLEVPAPGCGAAGEDRREGRRDRRCRRASRRCWRKAPPAAAAPIKAGPEQPQVEAGCAARAGRRGSARRARGIRATPAAAAPLPTCRPLLPHEN